MFSGYGRYFCIRKEVFLLVWKDLCFSTVNARSLIHFPEIWLFSCIFFVRRCCCWVKGYYFFTLRIYKYTRELRIFPKYLPLNKCIKRNSFPRVECYINSHFVPKIARQRKFTYNMYFYSYLYVYATVWTRSSYHFVSTFQFNAILNSGVKKWDDFICLYLQS